MMLTEKEKLYIVEDMLCILNSYTYEVANLTLKEIDNLENIHFDLPKSEVKIVISIIKKLIKKSEK